MKKQVNFLAILFFLTTWGAFSQQIQEETLLHDIKYLSSDELEGRKPLSKGSLKAREMIKKRFHELGLTSQFHDYTQFFDFKNRSEDKDYSQAANIVGFIPGNETDKLIVIMAHYDHIGRNEKEIFNGADDNASGTAAVLALAAYFAENRPNHSMMFVALDAEEMGLQGARALVSDFPFALDQIILNINMDMISRNDQGELYAVGTYHYPHLKPILERAATGSFPKLIMGHDLPNTGSNDWTMASDHALFHEKNVPFIYFGVEDHEDYHKATDTYENIQPNFYIGAVNLILKSILQLDADLLDVKF